MSVIFNLTLAFVCSRLVLLSVHGKPQLLHSSVAERKEKTCSKLEMNRRKEERRNQEESHQNEEGTKVEVDDVGDFDRLPTADTVEYAAVTNSVRISSVFSKDKPANLRSCLKFFD